MHTAGREKRGRIGGERGSRNMFSMLYIGRGKFTVQAVSFLIHPIIRAGGIGPLTPGDKREPKYTVCYQQMMMMMMMGYRALNDVRDRFCPT